MNRKNQQVNMFESPSYWFWKDNETVVIHSAGMLLITQRVWDDYPADIKAQFRRVTTKYGLEGRGIVIDNILYVQLL